MGVGEVKPTIVTLQLAQKYLVYREGKIEDVLVKVDKFIFPVEFISPTGKTLNDVQKGELTLRVIDQQVTFNVLDAMKSPVMLKTVILSVLWILL